MQEPINPATDSRFNEKVEYQGLSWKKTTAILGILLLLGYGGYRYILAGKPEARTFSPPASVVSVEAAAVGLTNYPVKINSNGTVAATTSSTLVAQVSGEITKVSASFASGGEFKQGEVLLEIDARNYASAVSNSSANYSQAQANLAQEKAEAAQALKEWQRLGFDEQPSDLVLRKPQLAAAEAAVKSAKAAYEKAQLDFSRTKVRAPFNGSIVTTSAARGQFVSVGTPLGDIFSDEGLEVPLPLNQAQYSQLILENKPPVLLSAIFGGVEHQWQANIVRSDNVFDSSTRQLNVIAKISNPLSDKNTRLKIGQYVSAIIDGRIVEQALVVPNQSIREGRYVYLYDEGILRRSNINITWQDNTNAIVEGISPSDLVVSTSLGGAVTGASARLIGDDANRTASTNNGGNFRDLSPEQQKKMQGIRSQLGLKEGERPTPEQRQKIRTLMQEG